MGTWGTSLYANDSACDIRGDYVDKLKRGKSNEIATQEIIEQSQGYINDDEDGPLFWFALADTQWNYGRLLSFVKEKALYFIPKEEELGRWKETGKKAHDAWIQTMKKLETKLNSPQPPEKKVSKYRFYKCKWELGDVFSYRLSGSYSEEKGLHGKYILFRKVSEDTWWPGHIIPVVQIYDWVGDEVPTLDIIPTLSPLPMQLRPISYKAKLISDSEKSIPKDNLRFIGNYYGDDLVPFRGHKYWTGYIPLAWESSKYNAKLEEYFIIRYLNVTR